MLPKILCSADGVSVSYFARLQSKQSEFWDLEEVDTKLHRKMVSAYDRVRVAAQDYNTDWCTAAYIIALSRLGKVHKECGIFP